MTALTDWLDAAKTRADAATEGSWWVMLNPAGDRYLIAHTVGDMGDPSEVAEVDDSWDAEFIAAARTDLPKALDALRAVLDLAESEWWDAQEEDLAGVVHSDRVVAVADLRNAITTALGVTP